MKNLKKVNKMLKKDCWKIVKKWRFSEWPKLLWTDLSQRKLGPSTRTNAARWCHFDTCHMSFWHVSRYFPAPLISFNTSMRRRNYAAVFLKVKLISTCLYYVRNISTVTPSPFTTRPTREYIRNSNFDFGGKIFVVLQRCRRAEKYSADAKALCLLANTADYCLKQLEKISQKMKDIISPKFADRIDLSAEQNRYEGWESSSKFLRKFIEISWKNIRNT